MRRETETDPENRVETIDLPHGLTAVLTVGPRSPRPAEAPEQARQRRRAAGAARSRRMLADLREDDDR